MDIEAVFRRLSQKVKKLDQNQALVLIVSIVYIGWIAATIDSGGQVLAGRTDAFNIVFEGVRLANAPSLKAIPQILRTPRAVQPPLRSLQIAVVVWLWPGTPSMQELSTIYYVLLRLNYLAAYGILALVIRRVHSNPVAAIVFSAVLVVRIIHRPYALMNNYSGWALLPMMTTLFAAYQVYSIEDRWQQRKWAIIVALSAALTGLTDIEPALIVTPVASVLYLLADEPRVEALATSATVGVCVLIPFSGAASSQLLNIGYSYLIYFANSWFDAVGNFNNYLFTLEGDLFVLSSLSVFLLSVKYSYSPTPLFNATCGVILGGILVFAIIQGWFAIFAILLWPIPLAELLTGVNGYVRPEIARLGIWRSVLD